VCYTPAEKGGVLHTRRKPSGGASGLNLVQLAVRGHLDDGRGGALPVVNKAELDAEDREEGVVRTRTPTGE
jgi:hypothetical protein